MVGYNFRLGEIEAAIGIEQLKKLDKIIEKKQNDANKLYLGLKDLKGLTMPIVQKNATHVYYMFPMVLDIDYLGVTRKKLIEALEAEGVEGLAGGSKYSSATNLSKRLHMAVLVFLGILYTMIEM